ncbi:MAG: hypothetical protein IJX57_06725 [Clostridia bacterium]|nr:hypothetical protein [Clostridia bacterium]
MAFKQHYHCMLCGKSFPTKEAADDCFNNHSEIEHLRWVAVQSKFLKSYTGELFSKIDFIIDKYGIEEQA